ncbi:protein of unknown function [Psychroflexus salarius]|uniref:Thioredoxin domain-containing protein n=1 Tax=Psychroflexus salarius TaxID=1155689 RepID=A0A1M4SI19_9FLAO|nr:thioredoxin-like domain-containing protein [Psychroflexus salarius]SHE31855.1 protein of unknown function [Psychroflexus salarius]
MRYYYLFFLVVISFSCKMLNAQQIKGQVNFDKVENVKLFKYRGNDKVLIDSTAINNGFFSLSYNSPYNSMGSIVIDDTYEALVVLGGESIEFSAKLYDNDLELNFSKGRENKLLANYTKAYPFIKNSISALEYLEDLYGNLPQNKAQSQAIELYGKEIKRLQLFEHQFDKQIDTTIILKHYLPLKRLLSNLAEIAKYEPNKHENVLKQLARIDYASDFLFNSGILNESISYHIWFIANVIEDDGLSIKKINQLIKSILSSTQHDNYKFNTASALLLEILQKGKRTENLIYLKRLLNQETYACSADSELLASLQRISSLKLGAKSPDFDFPSIINNTDTTIEKFSELQSTYKLLVFAGSWCSHCRRQIPKLNTYKRLFNKYNVKVVLFSVEHAKSEFYEFTNNLDFLSMTDLKGWKSDVVQSFKVKATPTYFIVNQDNQLVLKPNNLIDISNWLSKL